MDNVTFVLRPNDLFSLHNGTNAALLSANSTTDSPEPYSPEEIKEANYVTFVVYPILLGCCTVGNVLNLIVLTFENNKGSTNTYMIAVAVADLFVVWLYMPSFINNSNAKLRETSNWITSFGNYLGLQTWGQETAIQLCDWVLIVFSLERLAAVTRPLKSHFFQTLKASRIVVCCLLLLTGTFTLYNPIELYYYLTHGIERRHQPPHLERVPAWMDNWRPIQLEAEVVTTLFKFFALLIINTAILLALRASRRADLGQVKSVAQVNSKPKQSNSTRILVASVFLYLGTQFPSLIMNCLEIAADEYNTYILRDSVELYASPFVMQAFLVNYSVNFFLYLTVSARFRAQFVEVFGRCCPQIQETKWAKSVDKTPSSRSMSGNSAVKSVTSQSSNQPTKKPTFVPTNLRQNPNIVASKAKAPPVVCDVNGPYYGRSLENNVPEHTYAVSAEQVDLRRLNNETICTASEDVESQGLTNCTKPVAHDVSSTAVGIIDETIV